MMRHRINFKTMIALGGLCLGLTGCLNDFVTDDASVKHPDHRIVVAPVSPGSKVLRAYPPECPSWATIAPDPNDNMPQPQIGCANQRNLALSIADPNDLIHPQPLGPADAVRNAAGVQRYHEDKTRGLYDPKQPAPAKE
jgi:hypothetical protein